MQQQHSTDVGNSDCKVLQPQRSSQCQNWRYPRFVSDKHHVVQSTCSLGIAMCPYEVANVRSLVIIEWWKHRLWELLMYRCQTDMPSFERPTTILFSCLWLCQGYNTEGKVCDCCWEWAEHWLVDWLIRWLDLVDQVAGRGEGQKRRSDTTKTQSGGPKHTQVLKGLEDSSQTIWNMHHQSKQLKLHQLFLAT